MSGIITTAGDVTAANVATALADATTDQAADMRESLSVGVAMMDNFARHAEGTTIAHGSAPLVGPTYRLKIDGSAPVREPFVYIGGVLPQGGSLMYLGSDLGENVKRFDFDLTCYGTGGVNSRNGFTIGTSPSEILAPTYDAEFTALPVGMVHLQLSVQGIAAFGIGLGGASFTTISANRGAQVGGLYPWNPEQSGGGNVDYGRPWRLTLEFEGTTCRVTAFGRTYEFTDPSIAAPRHWFWECQGNQPDIVGEFTILRRFAISRDYSEPFSSSSPGGRLGDFLTSGPLAIRQTTVVGTESATFSTLTLAGNLANNDIINVGARTYTAKSATPGTNEFLIGASASATIDNLHAVINKVNGGGSLYGDSTTMHEKAWTSLGAGDTLIAYAKSPQDTLATTKTAANASWSAAAMSHQLAWPAGNLSSSSAKLRVAGDLAVSGQIRTSPVVGFGIYAVPFITDTLGIGKVNAASGTETLDTLAGGQMVTIGDTEEILWTGTTAATANNKRWIVETTGGTVWDSGAIASNNETWTLRITRQYNGTAAYQALQFFIEFDTPTIKQRAAAYMNTTFIGQANYVLKVTTLAAGEIYVAAGRCVAYVK